MFSERCSGQHSQARAAPAPAAAAAATVPFNVAPLTVRRTYRPGWLSGRVVVRCCCISALPSRCCSGRKTRDREYDYRGCMQAQQQSEIARTQHDLASNHFAIDVLNSDVQNDSQ